jgi:ATP dependent DNA ligase-like protein
LFKYSVNRWRGQGRESSASYSLTAHFKYICGKVDCGLVVQVLVEFSIMPTAKVFSFEPMLCHSVECLPEGHDWQYELKLDGFRAVGGKSGRSVQLWSRNHKDFSRRFPELLSALQELPGDTVIDGEIVTASLRSTSCRALAKRQELSSTLSIYSCCAARIFVPGHWRGGGNGCTKLRGSFLL